MTITPFTGGDAVTMSSQEIADLVGSRHDKVKQSIDRLVERGVISQPPVGDGPKAGNGVVVQEYLVNKRDSFVVVAQLSPEFTGALVDRWQELEGQVRQQSQAPTLPQDYIGALEHLLTSKRAEQLAIEQRDKAIETKAEIGSRREATAMATASAAVRQVQKLKDDLGLGTRQAAILAVEKAVGRKFGVSGYVPLRRWCKERGITAPKVFHPTYGFVRCWPAGAWMDAYQIDLADLFGADGEQA